MNLSKKFIELVVKRFNKMLIKDRKRLVLIESANELPSPKPRTGKQVGWNKMYASVRALNKEWFITGISDTNSMEPVIDQGHYAIFSPKRSKKDLIIGDIILMQKYQWHVMHRIVHISQDNQGWYCLTRGDNTVLLDTKTRYKDIVGICRGMFY